MFSKLEAQALRGEFWTALGKYLAPIPSASGEKLNWINYKTGLRPIAFKMDAGNEGARVFIDIDHPNDQMRLLLFRQFQEAAEPALTELFSTPLVWEENLLVHSRHISRIRTMATGINLYNRQDWPALISFLKHGILALDRFWIRHKEFFELLVSRGDGL